MLFVEAGSNNNVSSSLLSIFGKEGFSLGYDQTYLLDGIAAFRFGSTKNIVHLADSAKYEDDSNK